MAASFPDTCLQIKPFLKSLLNITGKSVRIFKTTDFAEMRKSQNLIACLLTLETRKHDGLRYWKANKGLHVMNYQRKSVFINKKDSSLTFKRYE